MSKKLFSFIREGQVRLGPETKIIPASELATLLEAEEVQRKIKEDADRYRKEVVLEAEALKAKAQADGYQEGFKAWAEEIAKLEQEIMAIRKHYEKILAPVALKSVQKLIGRELDLNEEAVVDIVANTLKAVSTHKKITIWVSPKEKGVLEKNKARLKAQFENLEVFQIRERADIEPGGSIIETEGGIINAQLSNQWLILESAFEKLFKKKSETAT